MSFQEWLEEPRTKNKSGTKIIHSIQVILDSGSLSDLTKQKMNLVGTSALASILPLPLATFLRSNCMQKGRGHGWC